MMKVLVAAMSLPVDESSALIKGVTEEVKQRKIPSKEKSPRIMLVGDQIDDVAVIEPSRGQALISSWTIFRSAARYTGPMWT